MTPLFPVGSPNAKAIVLAAAVPPSVMAAVGVPLTPALLTATVVAEAVADSIVPAPPCGPTVPGEVTVTTLVVVSTDTLLLFSVTVTELIPLFPWKERPYLL
jgi:hypothetical protein